MINFDVVKGWDESFPFDDEEKKLLDCLSDTIDEIDIDKLSYDEKIKYQEKFEKKILPEYFKRMPNCNVTTNTHTITFGPSATYLIRKLFQNNVDENTLVVTSYHEHVNPTKIRDMYSHSYKFSTDDWKNEIDKIVSKAVEGEYSKVFLYVIGTRISYPKYTPNEFYIEIKKKLTEAGIENITVIDDVQGMFMLERDYNIADYVIGTAHALVESYDLGICVSKKGLPVYGTMTYNRCKKHIQLLDIILKRKEKFFKFGSMIEEAIKNIDTKCFEILKHDVPYIFSMGTNRRLINADLHTKLQDEFHLYLDGADYNRDNINANYIRFRAQQFVIRPGKILQSIKKIPMLIELYDDLETVC